MFWICPPTPQRPKSLEFQVLHRPGALKGVGVATKHRKSQTVQGLRVLLALNVTWYEFRTLRVSERQPPAIRQDRRYTLPDRRGPNRVKKFPRSWAGEPLLRGTSSSLHEFSPMWPSVDKRFPTCV